MNAIILAAGMGTRLGKYTANLPKGLLQFAGRSLLEHQISSLRSAGIKDISIVTGYQRDKIKLDGVRYFANEDFNSTNMVTSLMVARDVFNKNTIVSYSDIIYEPSVVESLVRSTADISVVVDDSWVEYWKSRSDDWASDVESLSINSSGNIVSIGKKESDLSRIDGRYVGLLKFSDRGSSYFKRAYDLLKSKHWDSDLPWRNSRSFKKAYMTCMMQELIDSKIDVTAVRINRGWMEFDTEEDYEKANQWLADGSIGRFINLQWN